MAALALSACTSQGLLREFTTDGCSLFPDNAGNVCWADCCVTHDQAYWRGGSAEQRTSADAALRNCVQERTQSPALAEAMYLGTRIGGMPFLPTWFRWAYGWAYGRGYAPLSTIEQHQADQKLAVYQSDPLCPAPVH